MVKHIFTVEKCTLSSPILEGCCLIEAASFASAFWPAHQVMLWAPHAVVFLAIGAAANLMHMPLNPVCCQVCIIDSKSS